MKRRNFLKTAGTSLIGLPFTVQGMKLGIMPNAPFFNLNTDKILVLIKLSGGNDGLNTIIPLDQYANLSNHRSNVILPESSVLNLTTETGLHPAMAELHNMYVNNGEVAIIQGVGYPNPNRSHFRSTDIIHSGSSSNTILTSGFLGRYLDTEVSGYPEGFPNSSSPDPFALVIGTNVSKTCQGAVSNYSLAITNPDNLNPLATGAGSTPPPGYYADRLNYLRSAISQTNAYGAVIQGAAGMGNNLANYPNTSLANKLKIVANLISGGLKTNIYVVSQGGYDTHSGQVSGSDPTTGKHSNLLAELSGAIGAFQNDLNLLGIQDRVLGLTYSEFGRRIKSNGGKGTDHGDAGPMIMFGSKVNAGLFGTNPTIPATVTNSQAVPMQFDFRQVYRSILDGWFCASPGVIDNNILFGSFSDMGAVDGPCSPGALPVELISFEAQAMTDHIALFWEVGEMDRFSGFQVQRSDNGIDFTDLEWVETKNSNEQHYNLKDTKVELNHLYYYRLKLVNEDNSYTYSDIRTGIIEGEVEHNLEVYPNPARNYISVKTDQNFESSHLFILNKNGEPVYDNETWNGETTRIRISHLSAGIYTTQVLIGRQMTVQRFVKVD